MKYMQNMNNSYLEIVKEQFLNNINEEGTNKEEILALQKIASNLVIAQILKEIKEPLQDFVNQYQKNNF